MPTLLEMQNAMQASLLLRDSGAIAAMLAGHVPADRLDIYRNTFTHTLTKALRLCFPATQRLVGEEFFEGATQIFIGERPPRIAWLDLYGSEYPGFLRSFAPAASIGYLGDVAELEWAVNSALHAADVLPLDVAGLGTIEAEDQPRICFSPNPATRLLRLEYPADIIWRAVLDSDDDMLGRIDLGCGPRHLLIERRSTGVEVEYLAEPAWSFLARLCHGLPIEAALADSGEFDYPAALAQHLALGRFVTFSLAHPSTAEDPGKII
jgi:putative DNA-binding protein